MRTTSVAAFLVAIALTPVADAQYRYGPRPPYEVRDATKPVYRFFNADSMDHLYTDVPDLEAVAARPSYVPEGVAFYVYQFDRAGRLPLFRFYKPSGGHFYATSRDAGAPFGARLERIVGFVEASPRVGTTPLYVWYNPTYDRHFYTTHPRGEDAPRNGYRFVGVVANVLPA